MRDIRLIRDQRSGKSKGVGYVEFGESLTHTPYPPIPPPYPALHLFSSAEEPALSLRHTPDVFLPFLLRLVTRAHAF